MDKDLQELDLTGVEAAQLGTFIRELRESKGWSQAELADMIEVAQRTISGIEQGNHLPSIETAFKLADVFGIDINAFRKLPKATPRGRGRPKKSDES